MTESSSPASDVSPGSEPSQRPTAAPGAKHSPDKPATASAANRWALRVLPPLVYLICSVILYSRFLAHPKTGVPGGPDGLLYCWYFAWTEFAVVHGHNPFVTDWLNAPAGINSMWNTGVFGLTVLFLPITAIFGPVAAGGLAMVLSPVASATTCYLVLRKITGTGWAAAFVSLLYGFGPFYVGQSGHLHLIFAPFPPLILFFGYQLFISKPARPRRDGIWLGIVLGLQFITGEEVLVITAVITVIAVLGLMILNPRQIRARTPSVLQSTAIAAVVTVVIAGIPLAFQFFGKNAQHSGFSASTQRVAIKTLIVPTDKQRFASTADINLNRYRMPANGVENTGFLGWPLIIVIALSCLWLIVRRERFVWWWLLTAAVTVVFSFGAYIQVDKYRTIARGPWTAVRKLPLLSGIVPVRFSMITALLVALLLVWTLACLPKGKVAALGLVIVMAAMIPLLPARRYAQIEHVTTPKFFSTSAVDRIPAGAVTVLMPITNNPGDGARAMLWQMHAHLRFKLVGGWGVFLRYGKANYSSLIPEFVRTLEAVGATGLPLTEPQILQAQKSLAGSGVRYIVVTAQQRKVPVVVTALSLVANCQPEVVSDVTICQVAPNF